MDGITDPIITAAQAGQGDLAKAEAGMKAAREKEAAARTSQNAAMAPTQDKLKGVLDKGAPPVPDMKPMPEAPAVPKLDHDQMKETMALIVGLAAMGGALTRHPLTAALNSFSAGVDGLQKGQTDAYNKSVKEFETQVQKAKTENDSIWRQYEAASKKYGADITGLQSELRVIAAQTQSPIDQALAEKGDISGLYTLHQKQNEMFVKAAEAAAQFHETHEQHAANNEIRRGQLQETKRYHDEQIKKMAAAIPPGDAARDKILKDFQAQSNKLFHDYTVAATKGDEPTAKKNYEEGMAKLQAQTTARRSQLDQKPAAPAPAAQYKSPDDVKAAVKAGSLPRDQGIKILQDQFGFDRDHRG